MADRRTFVHFELPFSEGHVGTLARLWIRTRRSENSAEETATSAQVEYGPAGVARHPGPNLDELELNASQLPVRHFSRKGETPQEVPRQLPLLCPLLVLSPPVVKPGNVGGFALQVGDDESHPGEELSGMPLHLADDSPGPRPGGGPVEEGVVEDSGLLGRLYHRPRQQVFYLGVEVLIGGYPYGVEDSALLQVLVDLRGVERGISPEVELLVRVPVPGHDRLQQLTRAFGRLKVELPYRYSK